MIETDMMGGINMPMLAPYEAALTLLSHEKREHFLYLIQVLMDCYQSDRKKAVVLVSDGVDDPEQISVMAINADPSETEKLIDQLCVFGKMGSGGPGQVMN